MRFAIFIVAMMLALPAYAQNTTGLVVDTCGDQTFLAGNPGPFTVDTTGALCVNTDVTTDDITVGTTNVVSGTTGRVLYDNGGVLGNYAISGTGSVAMTTSPTFVTPTLGVAVGTSLALGGATLGGNALAVTGTAAFSGAVTTPGVSGGAADITLTPNASVIVASGKALQLGNAYAADTVVPTGYVTIKDSTGTLYDIAVRAH